MWMNRIQTEGIISECEDRGVFWACSKQFALSEPAGWLDIFQPPHYHSGGTSLLQIASVSVVDDLLHFRQLVKGTTGGSSSFVPLTSDAFVVTEIVGWNEATRSVFFMGTAVGDPRKRQLYFIRDDATDAYTCMTCLLPMPGSQEPCKFSSVSFSSDYAYYVHSCRGPSVPEVIVCNIKFNI